MNEAWLVEKILVSDKRPGSVQRRYNEAQQSDKVVMMENCSRPELCLSKAEPRAVQQSRE
jgi:hypothetical protein